MWIHYYRVSKTFVVAVFRGVMKHNTGGRASAISYFIFSAMIPMLILMIYGASFLVPELTVEHLIDRLLKSYVPQMPEESLVPATIRRLAMLHSAIRIIGILGFLWTTIGGFVLLQQIVDEIWEVHHRRSFWRQYLVGFVMLAILLAVTVVASIFTAISPALISGVGQLMQLPWLGLLHFIAGLSLPVILFVTCFFIYRVLPSHTPKLLPTLVGAMFATVAIYVSRSVFMIYTHHLGNYQVIYGALTFVMLLTFWIYIVSIILLLGVEVTAAIEHIRESR